MKNFLFFALLMAFAMLNACQKETVSTTDLTSSSLGGALTDRGGHPHPFGDSLHHCDSLHLDSMWHHHHGLDSLHLDSLGNHHHVLDSLWHNHLDSLGHPPIDTNGHPGGPHGGGPHGGGPHGGPHGHHGGN